MQEKLPTTLEKKQVVTKNGPQDTIKSAYYLTFVAEFCLNLPEHLEKARKILENLIDYF